MSEMIFEEWRRTNSVTGGSFVDLRIYGDTSPLYAIALGRLGVPGVASPLPQPVELGTVTIFE